MQNLLSLENFTTDELYNLLTLAQTIKASPEKYSNILQGKSIAMLFEKPSLRTRVSFDVGINKLGGHCIYLDQQNGALGKREPVSDFASNLSCWVDAIIARTFSHKTLEELAQFGSVPVINALSDLYHPCQALADFLTLTEQDANLKNIKLAYIGDGNNVTHSLMIGAAILGMSFIAICPNGYFPAKNQVQKAVELAKKYGGSIEVSSDINAIKDYDAIYTDTWISMGDDKNLDSIHATFAPFQVNDKLMQLAGAEYFMHCLPAYRGIEVTEDVIDSKKSLILQQAENRMHAQNAVLARLLAKL